jgi:predicted nucleic acid-binding protein
MNLYIDTRALIKLFIQETSSDEVRSLVENADMVATGLITRAETAAGINRLTRMSLVTQAECEAALSNFRKEWGDYHRIIVTEQIVIRADFLTGQYSLRGYDAVHLACALTWSELLGAPVTIATFDKELHEAAQKSGMEVFP